MHRASKRKQKKRMSPLPSTDVGPTMSHHSICLIPSIFCFDKELLQRHIGAQVVDPWPREQLGYCLGTEKLNTVMDGWALNSGQRIDEGELRMCRTSSPTVGGWTSTSWVPPDSPTAERQIERRGRCCSPAARRADERVTGVSGSPATGRVGEHVFLSGHLHSPVVEARRTVGVRVRACG
jgi:hypothetical protein